MRLQKFLALAGIGSRRKCELLIKNGEVLVNGLVAFLGQRVNPEKDWIIFHGRPVKKDKNLYYYMLHKPKGYLSTVSDPFGRPTLLDLVKAEGKVYPVGRLDKDSEGLILLTNDGELAYRLMHPKFRVQKIYEVKVNEIPSFLKLKELEKGILLSDGLTAPCEIRILNSKGKKNNWLEIKLHEGRKREIRRMLKAIGCSVITLRRIVLGPLKLSALSPGKWRPLTKGEIQQLLHLKTSQAFHHE